MGAGIDMAPGDIAFKCNFATLDTTTGMVIKRRADRHFEDVGPVLCAALDGECALHIAKRRAAVHQMHVPCACLLVRCDGRQHALIVKACCHPCQHLRSSIICQVRLCLT